MAIHQVRLPDKAGTPRVGIAESPAPTTPKPQPAPTGGASPGSPRAAERHWAANIEHATDPDPRPWYRAEPWLAVELAAVVPVLLALAAPEAYRIPLVALGALLASIGLAMLALRDLRRQ